MANQLGTILKAMRVIETLADSGPMGVSEMSRRLGMHKSVVSRVLSTLKSHSFVRTLPDSGHYDLGLRVFELGQTVIERLPFRKMVIGHVEGLARETGETAYAGTFNHGEVVYLYDAVSRQAIRLGPRAGLRRAPWRDALGKVILAFQEERMVLADLRKDRGTRRAGLPDAACFHREMRRIRRRGYAVERDSDGEGVVSVAAPIRGYTGQVTAAIGVGGPAFRFTETRIVELCRLLVDRADRVSAEVLGLTPVGLKKLPARSEAPESKQPAQHRQLFQMNSSRQRMRQ